MNLSRSRLTVLGILILSIATFYSVSRQARPKEKISLMTFGIFHALAQRLYLEDDGFRSQLEAGKVVIITKHDMEDKTTKAAQIFKDHLGSESPVQSLTFMLIKDEICFICKTAYSEAILPANGPPVAIP